MMHATRANPNPAVPFSTSACAVKSYLAEFSETLTQFILDTTWVVAKTYAKTWPHEYIVQERVDNERFLMLADHIDTHGYESNFYTTKQIYFDHEGLTYWHMGNIINRCPESETYRRRELEGRLPT